jgi:rhomboid family GlyGly-CTERM serine protease
MILSKFSAKLIFITNLAINSLIAGFIIFFAASATSCFPLLSLERNKVVEGEFWRLFTSNFVHFGWPHTLMNLAAFVICALALLNTFSALRLLALIIVCCMSVGTGVYFFNPEYETYAGLSGAIHGFIVAGLLLNKRHAYWLNSIFIAVIFAKIIHEHQADYQANELQTLLPVAVAYDAHLYGAIAGLVFGLSALVVDRLRAAKKTSL